MPFQPHSSIAEVILDIDSIVAHCTTTKNPLVFFAALYGKVTKRVEEGILSGEFEDNARMERLDVIFANRYLEAYYYFQEGKAVSKSWRVAFEAVQGKHLILQHVFLGINAHINLDLGIAASETVGAGDIALLKKDFDTINRILAELTESAQEEIAQLSPWLRWVDRWLGSTDEALAGFSIQIARDGAWKFASEYHNCMDKAISIAERDRVIASLGEKIRQPGGRTSRFVLGLLRATESKQFLAAIKILSKKK
jgi:hypothetical protein